MSRKRGFQGYDQRDQDQELPQQFRHRRQALRRAGVESSEIAPGQRWVSVMEPDLGVGKVTEIDPRRVTVSFQGGECVRRYTKGEAPLQRVIFRAGDTIRTREGRKLDVESVEEADGLVSYRTKDGLIDEGSLSDTMVFTAPLERLLARHVDACDMFDLRRRVLEVRNRIDRSPAHGFVGARIELIPHQLYIAREVSSRYMRRLLLADEVGLGKTIEACLVLHHLMVTGRLQRVLIAVPETMVHVWFVELLRKFNLMFRILDRETIGALASDVAAENPFLEASLVLTDIAALADHETVSARAIEAGWDMLVVDEAHHLREGSVQYKLVEMLSPVCGDILMLTATPQQHGDRDHFARLRLLDPSRYTDYHRFRQEAASHRQLAEVTGKLLDGVELTEDDFGAVKSFFDDGDDAFAAHARALERDPQPARRQLVAELLDRHGIGRAMFRNTRTAVGGFPPREVVMRPLEASGEAVKKIRRMEMETGEAVPAEISLRDDPRVAYVAEVLRSKTGQKVLLICRNTQLVEAIDAALRREVGFPTALFHENLTLIQRDRNAAWFADPEGARILLCSEIGSEGRNFQFVHHLVLFDLPADPELVEQRIGRLDRIGQKGPVVIHVPYVKGTPGEVFARWYEEGLGLFSRTVPAAQEVYEHMKSRVHDCAELAARGDAAWSRQLQALVAESRALTGEISERLAAGRDRLLEQHSFRPREAEALVAMIRESEHDALLEETVRELFRARGILVEAVTGRTWKLWSETAFDEIFPGLRSSRPMVTFERSTALHREDYEFLSMDHPAVNGAVELFLGSQDGNAALALWRSEGVRELLLEAIYVVECIASPRLGAKRFLPPTPVRVVISHTLHDRSKEYGERWNPPLEPRATLPALENPQVTQKILPAMERAATERAAAAAKKVIEGAIAEVGRTVGGELERLIALSRRNPAITGREIEAARQQLSALESAIAAATPRLDAVRLILKAPPEAQP